MYWWLGLSPTTIQKYNYHHLKNSRRTASVGYTCLLLYRKFLTNFPNFSLILAEMKQYPSEVFKKKAKKRRGDVFESIFKI